MTMMILKLKNINGDNDNDSNDEVVMKKKLSQKG